MGDDGVFRCRPSPGLSCGLTNMSHGFTVG